MKDSLNGLNDRSTFFPQKFCINTSKRKKWCTSSSDSSSDDIDSDSSSISNGDW